jgi:hypothetical protein
MGILSEAFVTVIDVTRELDGKIYDIATDSWLPATTESLAAADTAVGETISALLDVVPFPIEVSILGIVKFNVDYSTMQTSLFKVKDAIRTYVNATTQ